MVYHYESHTATTSGRDGNIQSSSSVIVRELDDGEVGILMAGNNSILDPTLTPHMLASPTTNYDVESDALSPLLSDNDDLDNAGASTDEEETWFPALRHNSWIHGLDDEDDDELQDDKGDSDMVGKMIETLFATDVLEKEDDDDADDDADDGNDDGSEPERKTRGNRRRQDRYSQRPHKARRTTGSRPRQGAWAGSNRYDEIEDEDDGNDHVDSLVPVDIICVMLND